MYYRRRGAVTHRIEIRGGLCHSLALMPTLTLLLSGLIFSSGSALAAAEALSWEESLARATRANAELLAAGAELRAAEESARASWSGFLPQVSGELRYDRSSSSDGYSATISGSQNLFDGFQDAARVRQARARAETAAADHRQALASVSYELKSAFEGETYSRQYKALTADILRRREENLRLVELRYESGRENKGSVLLSRAYRDQARYEDLQAANARRVAQRALAKVIGDDSVKEWETSGEVPVTAPPSSVPDFQALVTTTPAYLRAVAQESSAEAGVTLARGGFFPSLDVRASAGRDGEDFFPDDTRRWSIGVGLTIPLFNGGRDFFGTRSASESARAAASTRQSISRDSILELEESYSRYIEAVEKLRVDTSFREAAQARAEIARRKYNNGLQSFEDWDVIENDLISRQKSYLQSKRDRVVAEAAWEQARGEGAIR